MVNERIVVIGAGLAGAGRSQSIGATGVADVVVLEARRRSGGRILTQYLRRRRSTLDLRHRRQSDHESCTAIRVSTPCSWAETARTAGWEAIELHRENSRTRKSLKTNGEAFSRRPVCGMRSKAFGRDAARQGRPDFSMAQGVAEVLPRLGLPPTVQWRFIPGTWRSCREDCAAPAIPSRRFSVRRDMKVYGYGDSVFRGWLRKSRLELEDGLDIRFQEVRHEHEYSPRRRAES